MHGTPAHRSDILILPTDPAGYEGMQIINSTSHRLKVYYAGVWQTLHTLTPGGAGGIGSMIIGSNFAIG